MEDLQFVEAPPGYDVTVAPKKLKLAPGESGTYYVTITATDSAVVGEWAFGSLTVSGGKYRRTHQSR